MAIKAKELRHKASQNQNRMKEILESSAEKLSADQEKEFDALDAEAESLLRQAEKIERIEKMEIERSQSAEVEAPVKTDLSKLDPDKKAKAEDLAIRSYLQSGIVPVELRSFMPQAAAEKDDNSMIAQALKEMGIESLATQTTTTTAGGYLIPRGFQAELEKAVKAYGGMWEAARILTTSQGNTLDWPTVNDTNNKAYLLAQSTSAATSAAAVVFGQQQFEAYKYTSGLIQVPTELLEDSEFNVASLMIELLAERIWRGTNEAFTTADGSSKPKGITVAAAHGNNTADDAALSIDDFINLEHEVDPGYRAKSKYMFHDSVLQTIKKLKDSQNMPIWQPSFRDGAPSIVNGYQYIINQDMAAFTAASTTANDSKKIALFGDFSKYIIRQVRNMRIVRLNERYGELDQTAFVVFFRVDGDLLDAGTHPVKYMRVATT